MSVSSMYCALRKRVTQIPNLPLLRAGNLPRPRAQTSTELVRPFICCLENDAPPFSTHQNLALISEPTLFRKPNGLTAAI